MVAVGFAALPGGYGRRAQGLARVERWPTLHAAESRVDASPHGLAFVLF